MCWCTPGIRTPNCGNIGCYPPKPKIDWEKVWNEYMDSWPAPHITHMLKEKIQELVEKQLKGEE